MAPTWRLEQARARWAAAQGLTAAPARAPADVLAQTGWLRTLGGVDAYLAFHARQPTTRAALEAEVVAGRLRVAVAARGCIYLIPQQHQGLALAIAQRLQRPRLERDAARAGLPLAEVAEVGAAIREVLQSPLSTDAVRAALPAGVVRNLGEAGKKVGLTTNLPVALRFLETEGLIERTPVEARLDTERYRWRRTDEVPSLPAEPLVELARLFFQVAGPATAEQLAEWSGFGKREVAAAMARLDLRPVAVEGFAAQAWLPAGVTEAPPPQGARLLAFEDNLFVLHGGTAALTDPRHHHRPLLAWGSYAPSTLGTAHHVQERLVLLDGQVAGAWEWDAGRVVVQLFDGPQSRPDLDEAIDATARILNEIGHARSFSLDTDEAVAARAARLL